MVHMPVVVLAVPPAQNRPAGHRVGALLLQKEPEGAEHGMQDKSVTAPAGPAFTPVEVLPTPIAVVVTTCTGLV